MSCLWSSKWEIPKKVDRPTETENITQNPVAEKETMAGVDQPVNSTIDMHLPLLFSVPAESTTESDRQKIDSVLT